MSADCAGRCSERLVVLGDVAGRYRDRPNLGLSPLGQDDSVKGLLTEAEQGLAAREVPGEGAPSLLADQVPCQCLMPPVGERPGPKRLPVVLGVRMELVELEVGLPAQDELGQRRRHGLGKDPLKDEVGEWPSPCAAPGVADVVETDGLQSKSATRSQPRGRPREEVAIDRDLLVSVQLLGGEVLGRLDARDGVVRLARVRGPPSSRPGRRPQARRAWPRTRPAPD